MAFLRRERTPHEVERRRPGATGTFILLANGEEWLLSNVSISLTSTDLMTPKIDDVLNRIFESMMLEGRVSLSEIWSVAIVLLRINYNLSDAEIYQLLELKLGAECDKFAEDILQIALVFEPGSKGFTDWIRSSLIANRIDPSQLSVRDVPNVLEILVATNRTIPLASFADSCLVAQERQLLESLV